MLAYVFLALLILSGVIIYQDIKTLQVSARLIHLVTLLCVIVAIIYPIPGISSLEHIAAGALCAFLAVSLRLYFLKIRNIDGFGEADVWLLGCAGLLIGPFWIGQWLIFTCLLAALLMIVISLNDLGRTDPDATHGRQVLPLTPTIVVTAIIFSLLLRADLINERAQGILT